MPGDDVTLVGVVVRRWSSLGKGHEGRTDIELALKANHLQVHNDRSGNSALHFSFKTRFLPHQPLTAEMHVPNDPWTTQFLAG